MAVVRKKKKKARRPQKPFVAPNDDPGRIAEFVMARYGAQSPNRQRQLYTQFRSQGAEFGEDPTGVRSGLIPLTAEMRNRLPEGWGGEGVQNVGFGRPQFDETKFELGQSATGRYFLRPITEFTGLGPSQVAAIREMDRRTQGQQAVIRANYSAAGDTAARDAASLSARLASIPGSGGTAGPASTSAATQAGVDSRMSDINRTANTLQAQRASMEALMQAPAIRQMGETEASAYGTAAQKARAEAIANFSSGNAQADAAKESLNALLRGQDLGLLGEQLRAGTSVSIADANNARAIQTNAATNATSRQNNATTNATIRANALDNIKSRLEQARMNNDTRTQIAVLKEQAGYLKNQNQIIRETIRLVEAEDADGNARPRAVRRRQYIQMLMWQGIPKARAIAAARAAFKN